MLKREKVIQQLIVNGCSEELAVELPKMFVEVFLDFERSSTKWSYIIE